MTSICQKRRVSFYQSGEYSTTLLNTYGCDSITNINFTFSDISTINNNNNKDLTLQEIGDIFNITRMRVCQIEKQAIQKIKKSISAK